MAVLAIIGAAYLIRDAIRAWRFLSSDRDGNSGRFKHWSDEDA
jgi:hypothetical protein